MIVPQVRFLSSANVWPEPYAIFDCRPISPVARISSTNQLSLALMWMQSWHGHSLGDWHLVGPRQMMISTSSSVGLSWANGMAADSARGRDSRSLLADYYRNPKVTSRNCGLARTLSGARYSSHNAQYSRCHDSLLGKTRTWTSASGTKQTRSMRWRMSASGGKADIDQALLTNLDLWVHGLGRRARPEHDHCAASYL